MDGEVGLRKRQWEQREGELGAPGAGWNWYHLLLDVHLEPVCEVEQQPDSGGEQELETALNQI